MYSFEIKYEVHYILLSVAYRAEVRFHFIKNFFNKTIPYCIFIYLFFVNVKFS